MKTNLNLILCLLGILIQTSCTVKKNPARENNFNTDWQFIRSDISGAENPGFDDSDWRSLDLPHDYSIEDLPEKAGVKQIGPFSEESSGGASTGHVMGGTAWYRKHFVLDKADEGKSILILFDGVYMNADVWINGNHLGNHPYGYTAFAYDLTNYLNPEGQNNVLAVQVKNEGKNSRWYSGSGIYRDVTLLKMNPIHIDLWGNNISTDEVTADKAIVNFETQVINLSQKSEDLNLRVEIKNPEGKPVAEVITKIESAVRNKNTVSQKIEVANPKLWSTDKPDMYIATIQLLEDKKVIDETTEVFGIRTIEFSADKGFLLNGENTLLKGGCMHHDNGILGSAT